MIAATRDGDLLAVSGALDRGVDPNSYDESGMTALMIAALFGYTELVNELLHRGANSELPCLDPYELHKTALMFASGSGFITNHLEIVECLLKEGGNIDATDASGKTPLHHAATAGMIKTLVQHGGNINARDNDDNTLLMILSASLDLVEEFERPIVTQVDTLRELGASQAGMENVSLLSAVRRGDIGRTTTLLESGANVNHRLEDTALVLAAEEGCQAIVELLLQHKADPNHAGEETALTKAAGAGHVHIVRKLISAGAEINPSRFDDEVTPLSLAAYEGHKEVVEELIRHGADKTHTVRGATPQDYARDGEHEQIIEYLS